MRALSVYALVLVQAVYVCCAPYKKLPKPYYFDVQVRHYNTSRCWSIDLFVDRVIVGAEETLLKTRFPASHGMYFVS
jgi:predicted RNA-binding protein associated with RNAse of E/G family